LLPKPFFLVLICTKSLVGWRFTIDTTGGAYSSLPDPLAGLGRGLDPQEREKEKGKEREKRKEEKRKEN